MRLNLKLGLVLVTSDCGITAECGVDKLVNTSAAHICAFCHTMSLCKNATCDAYTPLLWHKQTQLASRRSVLSRVYKIFFRV